VVQAELKKGSGEGRRRKEAKRKKNHGNEERKEINIGRKK